MKRRRLRSAEFFEFPPAVVAGGLSLNLYENIGAAIENYGEILNYTEDLLRLKTENGVLGIEGKDLCIKDMNHDTLLVSGRIHAVLYEDVARE